MAFRLKFTIFALVAGLLAILLPTPVFAQDCDAISCNKDDTSAYFSCINNKTACWESKIAEAEKAAITLKSTINILNGQINVLQLQIDQSLAEISALEKEITDLSDRIEGLGYSLDKLTNVLMERVAEQYKRLYASPLDLVFSQSSFSTKLSELKYLRLARKQTSEAMVRAETQRLDYDEQKSLKEAKQQELESKRLKLERQKGDLAGKRSAEQKLLTETQNNEATFQKKLNEALSEYQAIQAIIAGRGDETEVGHVGQGERIASVIQGASCNSSGTHVHLIVSDFGVAKNPFNYLKPGIDYVNCSGPSCGSDAGDPFNPSGSWDWPIAAKIEYWQGFGTTWAVRNTWVSRIYSAHNGIDIRSLSSNEVKSMQAGTLFQGSYSGSGGCRLRYVRVAHDDSSISSFYLHINY